jgi:Flp pilus assembly protein TadG
MSTTKSTPASASRRRAARPEAGTGLIGTLAGVTVFLFFLLFAVQMLVRLYATSAVTAAAFDAARRVASTDTLSRPLAIREAETNARGALGSFGRSRASFHWLEVDATEIVVEVTARPPAFVRLPGWLGEIDRTVRVRTERFR